MFDAIAGRYDLLNDLLSMGQVRLWRRTVARIAGARPGERVLDLAAGTGTSSLTFTAAGADCVACDFSLGMLRAGKSRLAESGPGRLGLVAGGAMAEPEPGRGGRARRPARLTRAILTPGHVAPATSGLVNTAPAPSHDRLGLN